MSSVYHILDKIPAIYHDDMMIEYESLAQDLVKSGKLRIDTDYHCNFARFTDPKFNLSAMISLEELTDPLLIQETKNKFRVLYARYLSNEQLEKKIRTIFSDLKKQLAKLQPVPEDTKMKLTRLLVQSAHPIVIKWLLHDKVEVFITYSHNIGDMMDIQTWQQAGSNSGMQSTDGKNVAVFVSCGGDPFAENNKERPIIGDGWAAVARLQIIAGQELGHFADIKRDERGRQITRHSADFACTRAVDHVKMARRSDLKTCDKLLTELSNAGMNKLIMYEEKLRFFHNHKISGFRLFFTKLQTMFYKRKLLKYAEKHKLLFVKKFVQEKYMSLMIRTMIIDMKFNLAPVADVYKRNDKEAEEAIACVEALARVPQQVNKWGHLTTMATMQGLYKVYYNEVIPSLIHNYSVLTGRPYKRNYHIYKSFWRPIIRKINIWRKKEQVLISVRDI